MDYIFDASPVILLFEKCDLRKQLLDFSKTNKLYVPSRVFEEFGRNIATHYEMQLTGTVGIIEEMRKQKILSDDDLRQIRVDVRKSGFYLSKKLLKELDKICSS